MDLTERQGRRAKLLELDTNSKNKARGQPGRKAKMADGQEGNAKLADGQEGNAKLADGQEGNAKLADGQE